MAATARANAQWLRTIWVLIKESKSVVISVDEQVANIGGMSFAPKTSTGGGYKLGYLAKTVIELSKGSPIYNKAKETVAHTIFGKVNKNRLGSPYRKFTYILRYDGTGIDNVGEVLDLAVIAGAITKAPGGYYGMTGYTMPNGDPVRVHGEDAARLWLLQNPSALVELEYQVREALTSLGDIPSDADGVIEETAEEE